MLNAAVLRTSINDAPFDTHFSVDVLLREISVEMVALPPFSADRFKPDVVLNVWNVVAGAVTKFVGSVARVTKMKLPTQPIGRVKIATASVPVPSCAVRPFSKRMAAGKVTIPATASVKAGNGEVVADAVDESRNVSVPVPVLPRNP